MFKSILFYSTWTPANSCEVLWMGFFFFGRICSSLQWQIWSYYVAHVVTLKKGVKSLFLFHIGLFHFSITFFTRWNPDITYQEYCTWSYVNTFVKRKHMKMAIMIHDLKIGKSKQRFVRGNTTWPLENDVFLLICSMSMQCDVEKINRKNPPR